MKQTSERADDEPDDDEADDVENHGVSLTATIGGETGLLPRISNGSTVMPPAGREGVDR